MVKQETIDGYVVTYDNNTNAILDFSPTNETRDLKNEMTGVVLSKRDDFKERGTRFVLEEHRESWNKFVDSLLDENKDQTWYNGVCLEASLICMERLSKGQLVDEAYDAIDVQGSSPKIYYGMLLSGWQNNFVTSIVGFYHKRGVEFVDYRNDYVNQPHENKAK